VVRIHVPFTDTAVLRRRVIATIASIVAPTRPVRRVVDGPVWPAGHRGAARPAVVPDGRMGAVSPARNHLVELRAPGGLGSGSVRPPAWIRHPRTAAVAERLVVASVVALALSLAADEALVHLPPPCGVDRRLPHFVLDYAT